MKLGTNLQKIRAMKFLKYYLQSQRRSQSKHHKKIQKGIKQITKDQNQ